MYPLSVLCPSLLEPEQGADYPDRAAHRALSVPSLHNIHLAVSFRSRWSRVHSIQEEAATVG